MSYNNTKPKTSSKPKWGWQIVWASALIASFLILIGIMLKMSHDSTEIVWQRRVYVFGSLEAIVFTAVGWLFGGEVHKAAAETAKKDAADARSEAEKARASEKVFADQAAEAAKDQAAAQEKARTAAAVVQNLDLGNGGATSTTGQSGDINLADDSPSARPGPVIDLKSLFAQLYPPPD